MTLVKHQMRDFPSGSVVKTPKLPMQGAQVQSLVGVVLAFSLVASSRSCSLVAVPGLIAVASLVAEHRLWSAGSVVVVHGLSCSAHVRSSWMSLVGVSGGCSSLRFTDFSLQWLLLLWSTGLRT